MSFHTAHMPNMGYTALSVPLITPTHHTLLSNSYNTLYCDYVF